MTQYTIQITPTYNEINSTPVKCVDNNTSQDLLTFTPSGWNTLQIVDGDNVMWKWESGGSGSWPPNTCLAFLLMNSAQLCTDDGSCEALPSPQSLGGYIDVTTGTLHQNQYLPQPAKDCSGYGSRMSYVTADSNQVAMQGRHSIPTGKYLKLTYSIWFKTSDFNHTGNDACWYYDPEIDVLPLGG